MSYRIFVDPALNTGFVEATGAVTGSELAAANEALYSDPAWKPGFDELWLCNGITEFVVMPGEIEAVAEMETTDARVGNGKVCLVITRRIVEIIGELYQHLVSEAEREVGICRTAEEGAAWLGLSHLPRQILTA